MSEASKRTADWRKAKQKAGYLQVGVWMTPEGKGELEAVAWRRQQELGACILDLVRYYTATNGDAAIRFDPRQEHRLEERIEERVIKRLVAHGDVPATALGAPAVIAPPLRPPPPPGMKQCSAGHPPYPASTRECPGCVKARKQRQRSKGQQRTAAPKMGGNPGLAHETLLAICTARQEHPDLSLHKLGLYLFDQGIYRATDRQTGVPVPVQGASLKGWLDKAQRMDLLPPTSAPAPNAPAADDEPAS